MSLFSGYCEGGPLHGKMLHYGAPVYELATLNGKIVNRSQEARRVSPEKNLKWSAYRHENNRWVCQS